MNTIKVPFELYRKASLDGKIIIHFSDFIFSNFNLDMLVETNIRPLKLFYEVEYFKQENGHPSIIFTASENNEIYGKYQWIATSPNIYKGCMLKIPPADFAPGENVIVKDAISIILFYMGYIMNYQRDHKEAHPIPRKYSREHRVSTSNNKVYLLDDIVKYVHDNYVSQGGTHNIQCECWGVRGHYRTYKSGKQVWINAYKKGKKRQEMEPKDKTYYLSKGERV